MKRLCSGPATGAPRRKWLPLVVTACFSTAQAAPVSPQVVAGQATFAQQGNVYSITNTPNTIINWQSFSVGAGEVTRFIQQSSSSAVLNRILGQDPSQIFGALQSNGRVFLINPNGVLFGRDARIDVGGLVASSLNLSNSDFLAGRNNYTAVANAGAVSNAGSITTPSGGQVFLIAPNVDNSGIITSPQGDVILAAGHAVQFVEAGNPSVQVVVSAPDNAALNLGQVIAQGGRIGIYGALVNQRGRLNANSAVVGENGQIVLKASGDTLLEAGSVTSATGAGQGGQVAVLGQRVALTGDARIDASGQAGGGTVLVGGDYQGKNAAVPNAQQTVVGADASIRADAIARGDGGKVVVWADGATSMAGQVSARGGAAGGDGGVAESSGKRFLDFRGAVDLRAPRGKIGTLLLDPNNISINTGSDTFITQSGGSPFVYEANNTPAVLTPTTLVNQLAISDVNVYTGTGSITVLAPVSWSTANELTLSATTGIAVNAQVSNSSGGKLSLYTTGGNITQTAAISVPTLAAIADTGSVTLTHNGNSVDTLAGSGATGFSYHDADALTIGTVAGGAIPTQVGVSSSSGAIEISSGLALVSGGLTINGPLSTPVGTLNLRDYQGGITQSAALTAQSALIIADQGAVTLTNPSNAISVLAGYSNAPAGFSFVNSAGLTVGTVAGSHGVLSFGAAPLSLTALTGDLTISDMTYGVSAGNSGVSALTLVSSAGQVLGSGIVKGGATSITAATGINLAGTSNGIGALTASVTGAGDVVLVNDQSLSIASVSTGSANALVDLSTTTGSAYGIEVAGTIGTGAAGQVLLNAGGTGAITRTGASSVISSNYIQLQESSTGAIGTSGLPLLTGAVSSGNSDFHIGVSGAGPQGLYLSHTGRMTLQSDSHYGSNAAISIGATNDLTIAGNLNAGSANLTLDTSGSLASDNSSVLTGGTVNLLATQNIAVGSVVSATGSITMTAQQALTARGVSTAALNAGNVTLTANGGDMILGADGPLDARSNSSGSNGTVSLTSAGTIQMLAGNAIKAGALDLKAATGIYGINNTSALAIVSDGVQAQNTASGPIRLSNSGTNLSVGGASSYGIDQQGAGDVVLDNATGYTTAINKQVGTAGGDITIRGNGGIALTAAQPISSSGGAIQLTASDANAALAMPAGSSLSSGAAPLTISADNMSLGGTLTSSNRVTLAPYTSGVLVEVGALAGDSSGVLRLTSTELNGVHAPVLRIGSSTAGAMAIESALGSGSGGAFEHVSSALHLTSFGAISQSASATIGGIGTVALTAGSITLDQANATGHIAGSTSGSFAYRSANQVSVETVDGVSGITAGAGQAIRLKSDGAGIGQVAGAPLVVSSGTLVLEAAGPAQLNLITNSFGILGGALNQGGSGTKGPSEIYAGSNVSVNSVTAIDGSTIINGLSTNNQDLELSTGFITHQLSVDKPINVGTAGAVLETDNLVLNDTVTGNTVILQPHTTARPITVGSATCHVGGVGGCLAITRLDRVIAPNIGIGRRYADPEAPGDLYVAGITAAGTAVATDINPATTLIGLGSGGTITQGGPIVVNTLGLSAGGSVTLNDPGNLISTLAAETNGTAISYSNGAGFTVGALPANALIEAGGGTVGGVRTLGGNVTLAVSGSATSELAISERIDAGGGAVALASSGAVYGATGLNDIVGATLSVTASGSSTRGAGIGAIDGSGGLHTTVPRIASLTASAAGAGIQVSSLSDLVVGQPTAAAGNVVTTNGTLVLRTASGHALTINGDLAATGNIDLTAGAAASSNPLDQIDFAQNVTSSGGNITINAHGVSGAHVPSGANVSSHLYTGAPQTQPPTLSDCIANPTLDGCASVLPSLAVCTSAPDTAGCSAVLPSLAICTVNPTTAGCSAVLPSVSTCVAAPTTAGCSAVLPSLAVCTAHPATAGCSVVLPSMSVCVAAPSTAGCEVVLPSLAACTSDPSAAGCSAVLPTIAVCSVTPALPGCSAVLPTVAACTAAPALPGCSAVLPTVAACVAAPGLPGCAAVLPSLSMCVAAPATAGCSAVLPDLAVCVATPGAAGCSAVLPSLATCSSAPATAGCSAVLPTLAQCTSTPTLAGCSVVLPPVDDCLSNSSAAGCVALVPPSSGPVSQALNTSINVINATAALVSGGIKSPGAGGGTPSAASSGGPAATSSTPDDGDSKDKGDKKEGVVAQKTETKTEAPKKTFCN